VKKFVMDFHVTISLSEKFLTKSDTGHCQFLAEILETLCATKNLDQYLRDQKEISAKQSDSIYQQYKSLSETVQRFRRKILVLKSDLLRFILKSLDDHEADLRLFFHEFNISSQTSKLQNFARKEAIITRLLKKLLKHLSIFTHHEELSKRLSGYISKLTKQVAYARSIIPDFQKVVMTPLLFFRRKYKAEFRLQSAEFIA
jgi:hypothetical protein